MDWTSLGHAMWLAEIGELRLLFDPLLDDRHHGGVFEVMPGRIVDAAALRPDFVLVSHRHPDHFDVRSLRALAALDPDTVVVTPDALVTACARRLGFRTVRELEAGARVELEGARLVTTASIDAHDPEWGVAVEGDDVVVWNQVDTSPGPPEAVPAFVRAVADALGRSPERLLSLALVRWQPLLEVEATTAGAIGFPFAAYAAELDRAAALDAQAIVPASAGAQHAAPFAAMNRLVYPVPEARFLADAAARMPRTRVLPLAMGGRYGVSADGLELDATSGVTAGLVRPRDGVVDQRDFRPLEIPALVDPDPDALAQPARGARARARAEAWVTGVLAPATAADYGALSLVLEVVGSDATDVYTITRGRAARGSDPRWDVRCVVAASMLCDVLDGARHWGDVLLAGLLRSASRAYAVDEGGLRRLPVQPFFVYAALSYEDSVVRAVEHELAAG